MGIDYGGRLQNYAYAVIKDDVGNEFQRHLNDWKIHTNTLIMYARRGLNSFQTNLEAIKKAMEAERQRNAQMTMFVLSLMAGPALSFVAGALEHRLAPKLFGSRASTIRTVPNAKPPAPPSPPPPAAPSPKLPKPAGTINPVSPPPKLPPSARIINPSDPARPAGQNNKVKLPPAGKTISPGNKPTERHVVVHDPNLSQTKGKIVGDLGSSLMSAFLVNPAIKATQPDRTNLQNAINKVPDALDLQQLTDNLDNAWIAAQTFGRDAIQFFANTIREDDPWGDRLWDQLKKGTLPGVARASDDATLYNLGQEWIHALVNKQRETWAKQDAWYYYGRAPFSMVEPYVVNTVEAELWALWVSQESFDGYEKSEYGRTDREGNVEIKKTWFSYEAPIGRSRIPLERILPNLRRLGVLEGSAHYEEARRYKEPGLMNIEIDDIYGSADTKAELDSVNNWAASRKHSFFGGQIGSVTRAMGKLVVTGKY